MSRTTTTRVIVAAMAFAILGIAAFGDACSTRRGAGALHFVWLHGGGDPASGVEATLRDANGNPLQTFTLGDAGVQANPSAASVRIVDRAHGGVVLLDEPLGQTTPIRVPEAIRLRGRLAPARPDTAVRIGSGPRLPPAERYTLEHGRPWLRHARDGEAFGIAIPSSASRWEAAPVTGDGFESAWIAAAAPPQIVAVDGSGGASVTDVPIVTIAHGATLDVGTVAVPFARALEIQAAVGDGEVPRALMVSLNDPSIDHARRGEIARWISVIDQFDRRLFEHWLLRVPMFLPHTGRLRLTGLPPVTAITVAMIDTDTTARASRTATFTGDSPALVSFAAADLGKPRGARGTVQGLVRTHDRRPVAGARVVLSDVPERFETTTDATGHFTMPAVAADRLVTMFVEPPASAAETAAHIFRTIDPSKPVTLDLPRSAPPAPHPQNVQINCNAPSTNDQYPSIAGQLNNQWTAVDVIQQNWTTMMFTVNASQTGNWTFYAYATAFVGFMSQPVALQAGTPTIVAVNQPINPNTLPQATIRFVNQAGFFLQNMQVSFPSLLPDPDPLDGLTDNQGIIRVNCINVNPIPVFVFTPGGLCYEGDVNLAGIFTTVTVPPCGNER